MKKILSIILISILLTASVAGAAAAASAKDEVVYGILHHDGTVSSLYVVNIFDGGTITDYGNYNKISNLTTKEALLQSGDEITIDTESEKFYYQGYLDSKELPWNIVIRYYIDDKEIPASELAGMSGTLKISLSVTENKKLDSIFYNSFGLQIAVLLNNKLSSNIIADNATIAEAGGSKQINFTVLPGSPFEGTVTADVKDFEMEAISINGIRLAFAINIDSAQFLEQFSELMKGIEELDDGAGELLEGLKELSEGIDAYTDGLNAFRDGTGQLASQAEELYKGASSLDDGLKKLIAQNNNIHNGALVLQNAAFDAVNAQLAGMGLGLPALTPENYSPVLADIPDLAPVKAQLDGVVQFVQGLKGYTDGVEQLGKGAGKLAEGTKKFRDASGEIASSANTLYESAVKINSGLKELRDGLASYKEGTSKFRSKTSNIDGEIDKQISDLLDEISGTDESLKSFVSDKNTDITSVQFVLKTAPVDIPDAPVTEMAKPVTLSFWQKLLKLFGLYKE